MAEEDETLTISGEFLELGDEKDMEGDEVDYVDERGVEMDDELGNEIGEELGGEVLDEEVLEVPFGITIVPDAGYRTDRFKVTVFGTPAKARKVKIRTSKPGNGRVNDPVLAERVGDGDVYISGFTVVTGLGLREEVENQVWIYGQADIPYWTDKYTTSVPVRILPTPAVAPPVVPPEPVPPEPAPPCPEDAIIGEYICKGGKWVPYAAPPIPPPVVPPFVPPVVPPVEPPVAPPKYLTTAEAAERIRSGLPVYIKCVVPLLDLLPGFPYTPWIPILPGFAITDKP